MSTHVSLCGCCVARYWNKVNFEGMKQSFADGGGTDNLAVTPLLRRKVCGALYLQVLSQGPVGSACAVQWWCASLTE